MVKPRNFLLEKRIIYELLHMQLKKIYTILKRSDTRFL